MCWDPTFHLLQIDGLGIALPWLKIMWKNGLVFTSSWMQAHDENSVHPLDNPYLFWDYSALSNIV